MDRIAYKILALILLLLPLPTAAQRCLPVIDCPYGYEALDFYRPANGAGWHLIWFVQAQGSDGVVRVYSDGWSCKHGVCNLGVFTDKVRQLRAMDDYQAARTQAFAWIEEFFKPLDCEVADKPLCDERTKLVAEQTPEAELMFALKATPWPPLPSAPVNTYVVRSNGTYPTRPAYSVVNGVRGTVEVGRATVGASCTLSLGEYGTFGPLHAPNIVALCSLKK
jgi:hypothetical protein